LLLHFRQNQLSISLFDGAGYRAWALHMLDKDDGPLYVVLFVKMLFCPIDLYVCPSANTTVLIIVDVYNKP
jgi:hypothetical protein